MSARVHGLRGATTVDADTVDDITSRTRELVREMLDRNDLANEDLVSVIFTATPDVTAEFPATAARGEGLGDVPLLCAQELAIRGGTPRCIRVLMHVWTARSRHQLRHVYLHGAAALRDDLPG